MPASRALEVPSWPYDPASAVQLATRQLQTATLTQQPRQGEVSRELSVSLALLQTAQTLSLWLQARLRTSCRVRCLVRCTRTLR